METMEQTVVQERVLTDSDGVSGQIREAYSEIAYLRRRLDRLAKLQSLLKDKYLNRLGSLSNELSGIEKQQWELKSLERQLRKNKERREIIKRQIATLERRKSTIREAIKQVSGYERSSSSQVELIEEEQQILSQRMNDLEHILKLAEEAQLNRKELDIVSQRVRATQTLLKEHETDLSKRTIDLLFEFYIPPNTSKRLKL